MKDVEWGYKGAIAPEKWSHLCDEFAEAAAFKWQSPVDLTDVPIEKEPVKEELVLHYKKQTFTQDEFNNSYHLVPQNQESTLMFGDKSYTLVDIHVHCPSEHILEKTNSDFEVHFVHKDAAEQILVIGLLFTESNSEFYIQNEKIRSRILEAFEKEETITFQPEWVFPKQRTFYHLTGSLTTPPTSGAVSWIVMDTVQTTNEQCVEQIKKRIPTGNCRPVQPLNGRKIWHTP